MKRSTRILAGAIAALMLAVSMPISILAKTLTNSEVTISPDATTFVPAADSKLLLDIDNLGDTTNAVTESQYTYTNENAQVQNKSDSAAGETLNGDKIVTDYNGSGQWQTYVGQTNIPLTETSKYIIAFDAKMIASFNMGGFVFTAPGEIGNQSQYRTTQGFYFDYPGKLAYLATGMNWSEEVTAARRTDLVGVDVMEQHSYMITIDGLNFCLYIDGDLIADMELPADYWGLGTNVALGVRTRCDTAGEGSEVAMMKNIKVYEGGVVEQKTNELLLDIDNLADETNAVEGSTATYSIANAQNQYDSEYADGDIVKAKTVLSDGVGEWASFIGHTNLPLTATSQYTISFKMRMIANFNYGGFVFSAPGAVNGKTKNNTTNGIYLGYSEKQAYLANGMKWLEEVSAANVATYGEVDVKALQSYMIVIDGFNVTLYMNNEKVGTMTLASDYDGLNGTLSLGIRSRCDTPTDECEIAEVKNIKVYSGLPTYTTVNNYQEGDVLLKVPTVMSVDGCTSDFEDVTVTKPVRNQNSLNGDIANALYPDPNCADYADGNEWMWAGVKTTLPLNADSKYTIDFYMKKEQTANIGFCITGEWWRESQGFYLYNNSFTTVAEYSSNYYSDSISFSNIWSAYCDNDGFTRFTMEIDGYTWNLYIGGVYAGSVTIGAKEKFPNVYAENQMSLAVKVYSDAISEWDLTKPIVYVKDITVYGGNVATNKNIQFVKDGVVLDHLYAKTNDVITEFPAVEVGENQTAVWFYKGTNVVATAPFTVYSDATLEARVIDNTFSKVVGAQNTEAVDNKQSIRFLSVLQSLEGSAAGFEVTAKYLEGGVEKTKSWTVNTTHVYSSINATENGSVKTVTAADLGGTYICALSVDNVPTNIGEIEFSVKSFVVLNNVKTYSEAATFTVVNGAIAS
ncbi:MAG: hypothetical protein E7620_02700 [Ruminococcaceae bacterium]|nr:hypothetical protein [Oscillospiraceae bacterium]